MAYWKVKINASDIYGVRADKLIAFNTIGTNVINLIYEVEQKSQLVITLTVTAGKEEEVLQCIQDKTLQMNVIEEPFVTLMDKVTGYKICPNITNISIGKREI
tara:strand:+ start:390 stop:698 length:309 start_codon:yes stop_codon:yes gene_type:complete